MDLKQIICAYDEFLGEHGDDARSVGWRNAETQYRKFAEICAIFASETAPFSVYDVGCGLANLSGFLKERYPLARYAGCDIHPGMIEKARLRHPGIDVENRDILCSPPQKSYDYVVASGTFNLRLGNGLAGWNRYTESMLCAMYAFGTKGISAGFLSCFAENQVPDEYHPDPAELLAFAQLRLSPLAELRHSQSPGHFALFVYRAPRDLLGGGA